MLVRDAHLDAARIGQLDVIRPMNIPDLIARELSLRLDPPGAAELRIQRPMHGVVMVGSPAGDHPQAIGLAAQPARPTVPLLRMYPLFGVVDLGRTTEPRVVLQVRGDGLARVIGLGGIDRQADLDASDGAYTAGSDQLAGQAKLRSRALLTANLDDPPGLGDEVAKENSLADRHCEGLLQ